VDPAADVDPDRVRHDGVLGEEDAADRHAEPGMGIRHERAVIDRDVEIAEVTSLQERLRLDVGRPRVDGQARPVDDEHAGILTRRPGPPRRSRT
jgi:hypothetical protein